MFATHCNCFENLNINLIKTASFGFLVYQVKDEKGIFCQKIA